MELIRKITKTEESGKSGASLLKLLPYWPMFLILVALALAGAWLYMQMTTPLFEAHAQILIKDDKKNSDDTKSIESLDLISPKKSIDNEIEVIKSASLLSNVVIQLNLNAPVYQKERFSDALAYTSSPVRVVVDTATAYKSVPKVPFVYHDGSIILDNKTYPLNTWINASYGRLKFIKNPNLQSGLNSNIFFFSLLPLQKTVSNLATALKVSEVNKQSTIIDLTISDAVPQRAEDILNQLIKAYNTSLVTEKNVLASNTLKFIDQRLISVENELLAIEQKQQNYRSNKGAVDISTQGRLFLENVSSNDQKLGEIGMQLSVLKQVESYVKSKDLSNGIVPSTVGINDPGLSQMVKNIYDLQLEEESIKKTTGANNPMVVSLKDKIDKIKPQIIENLANQRQSLLASKGNLSTTNGSYSSTLQAMPETERTLVDINRQQSIKSGIYTLLLQKKEETALSFVTSMPGSKIINSAQASDLPVSPKRSIIYFASMLMAFIIGFLVVTVKESFGGNIMFQKDIEQLTILPVIGEITDDKTKKNLVIANNQRTLIAEQFRRLRTTLNHLTKDSQQKRIMVTSAISGEGKSFVAVNLSLSLALGGKKVVLLDFDLNKPSLSTKLDMEEGIGITEVLKGEAFLNDVLRPVALNENLFFISAGSLPDNPSELMMSDRVQELLDQLDISFDYIIIDVAPVGPVSDAYILSPYCDTTLYIVRHGYTPKIFVERIDENNKLNNLTNAVIVFNGVSKRGIGGKGYGYGYGYVYGSGNYNKNLD